MKTVSLLLILCSVSLSAKVSANSPKDLIEDLYASVSFVPGKLPDWKAVEAMFLENAIITLRTSRDNVSVFSVEAWVQDFKDFIIARKLETIGFNENIVGLTVFEYGDIAHALVVYEPRIPGITSSRQGIDSINLIRQNGEWKIVSILNELPTADRPIPDYLLNR